MDEVEMLLLIWIREKGLDGDGISEGIISEKALRINADLLEKIQQLPLRFLLVMDNDTAHPQDLDDDLSDGFDFIKVKSLPANTTRLLQPMDKQVMSNITELYTRALFRKCFEVTNDTQL